MNTRSRNIIELIGLFSIVVSLIFVGYELRQNSAIARFEAFSTISMSLSDYNHNLSADPELIELFTKVWSGALPGEFTQRERNQITLNFQALLRIWDSLFRAVDEGILTAENLDLVGSVGALNNPYFRYLWENELRQAFSPAFVEFLEARAEVSQ